MFDVLSYGDTANPRALPPRRPAIYLLSTDRPSPWVKMGRADLLVALDPTDPAYVAWRAANPVDRSRSPTGILAEDGRVYIVDKAGQLVRK